jgi:hypothetical protein
MNDVCVLFAYYLDNQATRQNFEILRRNNPDVDLHPLMFGDVRAYLPGSWLYQQSFPVPEDAPRHWYWSNCDLLIYDFFRHYSRRYDRYIYLEWDTLCNADVRDLYRPNWHEDLVTSCPIRYAKSRHSWSHFLELNYVKRVYFTPENLAGLAPLCGVLLSARCLEAITENVLLHWPGFENMFCEMRIATAAKVSKFLATSCPNLRTAGFQGYEILFEPRMLVEPGIYHALTQLP